MDHNDIIMIRYDSINNELSYGKYGNVSILGVGYRESMSRLWTFMQEGYSKECTLNVRLHRSLFNIIGKVVVALVMWHYERIVA